MILPKLWCDFVRKGFQKPFPKSLKRRKQFWQFCVLFRSSFCSAILAIHHHQAPQGACWLVGLPGGCRDFLCRRCGSAWQTLSFSRRAQRYLWKMSQGWDLWLFFFFFGRVGTYFWISNHRDHYEKTWEDRAMQVYIKVEWFFLNITLGWQYNDPCAWCVVVCKSTTKEFQIGSVSTLPWFISTTLIDFSTYFSRKTDDIS